MPSVTLNLPLHVTARPRKDGTFRVLFEVRRNRPADWPSTTPLPISARRTGKLDAAEIAAIKFDVEDPANGLLVRLERVRNGVTVTAHAAGTLPAVKECWFASADFKALGVRTRAFYKDEMRLIEAWSNTVGHPQIKAMGLPQIPKFLNIYADRPAQRAALRRTISAFFSYARLAGDCPIHPLGVAMRIKGGKKGDKRKVVPWTAATVDIYRDACLKITPPWPGGRTLLKAMWETSADATDVCAWDKKEHFHDEAVPFIEYERGKTGIGAKTPISLALATEIRTNGALYVVTDPKGRPYPKDDMNADESRARHFAKVQKFVVAAGGPRLLLDHLRHSAATDAIEKGATYEQTKSVTAHADAAMLKTIYVQKTFDQALAVQKARGIV
jgi:integrase